MSIISVSIWLSLGECTRCMKNMCSGTYGVEWIMEWTKGGGMELVWLVTIVATNYPNYILTLPRKIWWVPHWTLGLYCYINLLTDTPTSYMVSSLGLGFIWTPSYVLPLGTRLWTLFDMTKWLFKHEFLTSWMIFYLLIENWWLILSIVSLIDLYWLGEWYLN